MAGSVVRFESDGELKIPQMGWNAIDFAPGSPLLSGLNPGCCVYFVHSYYARPDDASLVLTETEYGGRFCSAIGRGNLHATQFHPEKSQRVGLKLLENFASLED